MGGTFQPGREGVRNSGDMPVEKISIPLRFFDTVWFNPTESEHYCREISLVSIERDEDGNRRRDVYDQRFLRGKINPIRYLQNSDSDRRKIAIAEALCTDNGKLVIELCMHAAFIISIISSLISLKLASMAFVPIVLYSISAMLSCYVLLKILDTVREDLDETRSISPTIEKKLRFGMDGEMISYRAYNEALTSRAAYGGAFRVASLETEFHRITGKKGILKQSRVCGVSFERDRDLFVPLAILLTISISLVVAAIILQARGAYPTSVFMGIITCVPMLITFFTIAETVFFLSVIWERLKIWKPSMSPNGEHECEFYVPQDGLVGNAGRNEGTGEVSFDSGMSGNTPFNSPTSEDEIFIFASLPSSLITSDPVRNRLIVDLIALFPGTSGKTV